MFARPSMQSCNMGAFGSGKGDFFALKIFLRAMRSIPVKEAKEAKENGISNFSDNSIVRKACVLLVLGMK